MLAETSCIVGKQYDTRRPVVTHPATPKVYRCLIPLLEQHAQQLSDVKSNVHVSSSSTESGAATCMQQNDAQQSMPTLDDLTRKSFLRISPNDSSLTADNVDLTKSVRARSKLSTTQFTSFYDLVEQAQLDNHEDYEKSTVNNDNQQDSALIVANNDNPEDEAIDNNEAPTSANNDENHIDGENVNSAPDVDDQPSELGSIQMRVIDYHMPNAAVLESYLEQVQLLFVSKRCSDWSDTRKRRHLQGVLDKFTLDYDDCAGRGGKYKVLLAPSDPDVAVNVGAQIALASRDDSTGGNAVQRYIGLNVNEAFDCWAFRRFDDSLQVDTKEKDDNRSIVSLGRRISLMIKSSAKTLRRDVSSVVDNVRVLLKHGPPTAFEQQQQKQQQQQQSDNQEGNADDMSGVSNAG